MSDFLASTEFVEPLSITGLDMLEFKSDPFAAQKNITLCALKGKKKHAQGYIHAFMKEQAFYYDHAYYGFMFPW